jgi:hypothetical protein
LTGYPGRSARRRCRPDHLRAATAEAAFTRHEVLGLDQDEDDHGKKKQEAGDPITISKSLMSPKNCVNVSALHDHDGRQRRPADDARDAIDRRFVDCRSAGWILGVRDWHGRDPRAN